MSFVFQKLKKVTLDLHVVKLKIKLKHRFKCMRTCLPDKVVLFYVI